MLAPKAIEHEEFPVVCSPSDFVNCLEGYSQQLGLVIAENSLTSLTRCIFAFKAGSTSSKEKTSPLSSVLTDKLRTTGGPSLPSSTSFSFTRGLPDAFDAGDMGLIDGFIVKMN